MMKKLFRGFLLAVSCCTLFSVSAAADSEKDFITPDGVLSLELPDDSWQQIPDVDTWVTLSNGSDVITVYHLSNGEILPTAVVADSTYSNVCQMFLSSRNEVFVITGSAGNESDFEDVREAVESAEILKKDTKLAVAKEQQTAGAGNSGVEALNKTCYVTCSSLNVRAGSSGSAEVLGTLAFGSPVSVTGAAKENGAYTGWYQISYQGRTGYVSSEYLSGTKPSGQDTGSGAAAVGSTKELYYANGNTVIIKRYSDGSWKDDGGLVYTTASEDGSVWTNSEGSRLTIYDPWEAGELPQANEDVRYLVNTETGQTVTVYETIDGDWIDKAADKYFLREDGLWMDPYGGEWAEQ
ncbi:MAG: SH3 domain-containing protein [Candidatus Choladocola sp.]|nr:SH3 domain-containing protein [Candidatus Choladocola sp.]